jgi:hypothetical protein
MKIFEKSYNAVNGITMSDDLVSKIKISQKTVYLCNCSLRKNISIDEMQKLGEVKTIFRRNFGY